MWDDFSNLTLHPASVTKCPLHHQISHATCMWDDFSNLTLHPSSMTKCPLHHNQSSHARCTQDDFSNFTSHPSSMTKCQLHQGACEMTFQISPRIHLAWPSVPSTTPKFSCEVDARWLSILTWCPSCVAPMRCPLHYTKVLTWGAREMTFQISPHIHLAWPSVPSTTPKFSHEVHVRWLFKSHLTFI